MTFSLDNAVVYDCETFPNLFSLSMEMLNSDVSATWEISHYRDDRRALFEWFEWLRQTQTPMIGFFSLKFDYALIHWMMCNQTCTVEQIYEKSRALAKTFDGWTNIIYDRDRFAPQIDLYQIHHFDNRAKTTSLKALQINMRSPTVMESPIPFGQPVSQEDVDRYVIPYNKHDVKETKRFALYSMSAINFRVGILPQFGIEVLNYNDIKIGAKMMENRLGADVCYTQQAYIDRFGNERTRRVKRQTPRSRIALNDIIFPYIRFDNPEFQRVLDFMKAQTLAPEDIEDPDSPLKTKGAITISANVGGIEFKFGTGGVHASVKSQRFASDDNYQIVDIDVGGMYPNIAIKNRLAPAHLGEAFITEYAKIPIERALHAKGTYENAMFKLGGNGPWGQSNNKFSIFYDPQYAMTVPVNGQLMICMLAEKLVTVPTLQLIQANTDGISYIIRRDYEPHAAAHCKAWEAHTLLVLEHNEYQSMWIRDVNNYIALDTKGKLKQNGAYWHPSSGDKYAASISQASPPCWYKDFNPIIVPRAAVAAMVHGIDPETFIRCHSDPFDFMCRAKAERGASLLLGGSPIQATTRYYLAHDGEPLVKRMPAAGPLGAFKRKNGVDQSTYERRMIETNGAWCETVCTKNKSVYEIRDTFVEAGWKIAECNDATAFSFARVDYNWYVNEARKLIIA